MPRVHLIEGPVGAGKSTYASAMGRETQGVHVALDDWFVALFSPDRPSSDVIPWYLQRKERLIELIWTHSQRILASGCDAILELGLIHREDRVAFSRKVREAGYELVIHVLDAPTEVRRERVQRRNTEKGPTFAMVVPDHIFEAASKLWEPPDQVECSEFEVELVPSVSAPP
mgnify:CR=1 FL=1